MLARPPPFRAKSAHAHGAPASSAQRAALPLSGDSFTARPGFGFRGMTLPLATALAFSLVNFFHTDIGILDAPKAPDSRFAWGLLALAVTVLGLTEVYLNLRCAQRLLVQTFVPVTLAFSTTTQCLQAMVIFGGFRRVNPWRRSLSATATLASLVDALCLQPSDLSTYFRRPLRKEMATEE